MDSGCSEVMVPPMKVHPDVDALHKAMRELEQLLRQHGEDFWASNVARAADLVGNSDAYGLDKFLSFFGGAGSLNDVALYRDCKKLTDENTRLDALRSKAWDLTKKLQREIG